MKNRRIFVALLVLLFVAASLNLQAQEAKTVGAVSKSDNKYNEYILNEVSTIHGVAGPFAVAGYRIGARAMTELEMLKGEFDLDVTHNTLAEVQWSCIADGIQAATGASVGKLNLRLNLVTGIKDVQSIVINKKTGEKIIFRLSNEFLKKYYNVPFPELAAAGRTVLDLADEQIFTMEVIAGDKQDKKPSPFERKRQEKTKSSAESKQPTNNF